MRGALTESRLQNHGRDRRTSAGHKIGWAPRHVISEVMPCPNRNDSVPMILWLRRVRGDEFSPNQAVQSTAGGRGGFIPLPQASRAWPFLFGETAKQRGVDRIRFTKLWEGQAHFSGPSCCPRRHVITEVMPARTGMILCGWFCRSGGFRDPRGR